MGICYHCHHRRRSAKELFAPFVSCFVDTVPRHYAKVVSKMAGKSPSYILDGGFNGNHDLLVLNVGNGWEWGNGMIITSDYGSFPHSLP